MRYNNSCLEKKSGGDSEKVTPVPIPNTEVKLLSADGSWRFSSCESRTSPGIPLFRSSSVVEHSAVNRAVVGSNPTCGAIIWRAVRVAEGARLEIV